MTAMDPPSSSSLTTTTTATKSSELVRGQVICSSVALVDTDSDQEEVYNAGSTLNRRSFRRLATSLLLLQVLSTIGFSWYTWYRDNGMLEFATTYIWQIWFLVTIWKTTIAYQDRRYYLFSASIMAVSWNGIVLEAHVPRMSFGVPLFARCLLLTVSLVTFELIHRCLRRLYTDRQQHTLNAIAISSVRASAKVGLLVLYLQADTLSGMGRYSFEEIETAAIFAREPPTLLNNNTTPYYYTLEHKEADDISEAVSHGLKAALAGGTLNMVQLFSFILFQVAQLDIADVLEGRILLVEALLVLAVSLLALSTVVFVAAHESLNHITYKLGMYFFAAMALLGISSGGMIVHCITKGTHPFLEERRRRIRDDQPSQVSEDSFDVVADV